MKEIKKLCCIVLCMAIVPACKKDRIVWQHDVEEQIRALDFVNPKVGDTLYFFGDYHKDTIHLTDTVKWVWVNQYSHMGRDYYTLSTYNPFTKAAVIPHQYTIASGEDSFQMWFRWKTVDLPLFQLSLLISPDSARYESFTQPPAVMKYWFACPMKLFPYQGKDLYTIRTGIDSLSDNGVNDYFIEMDWTHRLGLSRVNYTRIQPISGDTMEKYMLTRILP